MISLPYDFHIHSCLSPCADTDMTPANIVAMAHLRGLKTIAITDHNSCKNCAPAIHHGKIYGIDVIAGMELTTSEEIHVVCLFPSLADAMAFDAYVYSRLPNVKNRPTIFGTQELLNEEDICIGIEERLLLNATSISWEEVPTLMRTFRGIYFPAHVDKDTTSLIANLGGIPPNSTFDLAEVKFYERRKPLLRQHPHLQTCKLLYNSDAHYLWEIGRELPWLL